MARYSNDHKRASREAILGRAADRFRREGIAAVGVRQLMADAGLTHGAFYSHFASRADLVAAALDHAVDETLGQFRDYLDTVEPERRLEALIDAYLRMAHRGQDMPGCTVAALGPEIAREVESTRARFAARQHGFAELIGTLLPPGGSADARIARATVVFATMAGTLQLARIEPDEAAAERLIIQGKAAALLLARQPWD